MIKKYSSFFSSVLLVFLILFSLTVIMLLGNKALQYENSAKEYSKAAYLAGNVQDAFYAAESEDDFKALLGSINEKDYIIKYIKEYNKKITSITIQVSSKNGIIYQLKCDRYTPMEVW